MSILRPLCVTVGIALSACGVVPEGAITPTSENAALAKGPPIEDIVTSFDKALECMDGKVPDSLAFAVGAIADNTGKEQYADAGTGKLVSQGAGDMVQSALFRSGLTVVNRRDPNIPLAENNWGIRNIRQQTPSDLYISGSVTSLDFIPGGGAQLELAGVGPRYRQNRILVGLDLALTNAHSGKIVANVPLQKQIFAEEIGFSVGRFFGPTLASLDAGGMEREALQFTLRQMLSYATLQLLAQLLDSQDAADCTNLVSPADGMQLANPSGPDSTGAMAEVMQMSATARADAAAKAQSPAPGQQPAQKPTQSQGNAPTPAASTAPAAASPVKARKLGNIATANAAKAIAAGDAAYSAKTADEAEDLANQSAQYVSLAIKTLREAAAAGLTGPEGDTAATLVEQAINVATAAQQNAVEKRAAEQAAGQPPATAVPTNTVAPPVLPTDKRLGGAGQ